MVRFAEMHLDNNKRKIMLQTIGLILLYNILLMFAWRNPMLIYNIGDWEIIFRLIYLIPYIPIIVYYLETRDIVSNTRLDNLHYHIQSWEHWNNYKNTTNL